MLVKSAQLAKSWTTRPMREVSSVKINLGLPLATTPTKLISGRWLVGCEEAKRFVLHDADPRAKTHAHKVLWEQDEPIVSTWDVHSVSPVAGQSIVYVLLELPEIEQPDGSLKCRKLLEFRLIDESGEIYDTATIEPPPWAWNSLFEAELHGGKSRFLFIPTEDPMGVVFDTRTRVFYALPSVCGGLYECTQSDIVHRRKLGGYIPRSCGIHRYPHYLSIPLLRLDSWTRNPHTNFRNSL
ncbi:hypothetical protein OG21DRAFT_567454 [Imleria badia]|nr:hypothetical protein OG21DRAFT_567454 [Imleria badia]